MKRTLALLLFCISGFSAGNALALTEYNFSAGAVSIDYELPPQEPVVVANTFFWTIIAVCTVDSDTMDNNIAIKMLKKSGSVNHIPLNAGDQLDFPTQPGDKLRITADSGAKVELLNTGTHLIKASCTSGQ
jgi:hypothetical protein